MTTRRTNRVANLGAALAALFLLSPGQEGCSRRDSPGWRESWEWLVLTDQGALIDATFQVGNTGLEREQGELSFRRSVEGAEPVLLRGFIPRGGLVWSVDKALDEQQIGMGSEGIRVRKGTYTIRHGEDKSNAVLHLRPDPVAAPVPSTGGSWTFDSPIPVGDADGWIEDRGQGGPLRGRGILLHHEGTALKPGPRFGAYVLDDEVMVGLEQQGERRTVWLRLDGHPVEPGQVKLERSADRIRLSFPAAGLEVSLKLRPTQIISNAAQALSPPEQWLIGGVAAFERVVRAAQAEIILGERHVLAPAIVLSVGTPPP